MASAIMVNLKESTKYKNLCDAILRRDKTTTRRLVLNNAVELLGAKETILQEDIESLMSSIVMKSGEKKMKFSLNAVKTYSSMILRSLLDAAVEKGNTNVVKYIIPYYKFEKSSDREITLNYVQRDGRISNDCMQILLQYGFIITDEDRRNNTFIYLTVKNGHVAVIKELIKRRINLNAINQYAGLTLLHIARLNQHQEIIDVLIKNGASKEYCLIEQKWCDINNITPLCLAVINSDLDLMKLILENEPHTYDDSNLIVYINIALQKKGEKMMELLLDHLRNVDTLNINGKSLLQTCVFNDFEFCYHGIKQKMSEVLLKKGANVDIKDDYGKSILYDVIQYKNFDLLKTLLKYKANVNEVNDFDNTPLHLACYRNNVEIVKILLAYKAEVDVRNRYGTTPLHLACKNRNEDIIEILLEYKADPNVDDYNGRTPLHSICERLRYHYDDTVLSIIKMLMHYGAYPLATDDNNMNPIIFICSVENKKVSEVVFEHMFAYLLED